MSIVNKTALSTLLLVSSIASVHADEQVEVRFGAMFGDTQFTCGDNYSNVGTSGSTITPVDFRYFVHSVSLVSAEGDVVPLQLEQDGIWQYRDVALLDFEDGSGPCLNGNAPLNNTVRGTVPAGDYQGLRFTLGIPQDLNHDDVTLAASPLNLSAMFWNWRGGHRFFRMDMATSGKPIIAPTPNADGTIEEGVPGFPVHLGSTGCMSDSRTTAPSKACVNPNQLEVTFSDFDPERNIVVADALKLLSTTNVDNNTKDTAPGCMSGARDPDCEGILKAFGVTKQGEQQLFRMQ